MIKKTKHPKGRGERRAVKQLHSNASPVYKLLKEKEETDAASRLQRDRDAVEPADHS